MGGTVPKQFLLLHGQAVLWHTIKAFATAFADIEIILVLPANYLDACNDLITAFPAHKIRIVTGGDTRFASVKNGVQCVMEKSVVFVHDGVRCLVTPELIRRCYEETQDKGNAVPAVKPTDSIRIVTGQENEQIDRDKVRIIQTPQTFLSDLLIDGFKQDYRPGFTDEASVVEQAGVKINIIPGDVRNIKITEPVDFLIAEKIMQGRDK